MNKKKLLSTLFVFVAMFYVTNIFAQAVSINSTGAAPHASAILDISSADKGLLIPRVELNDADLATPITAPADGLIIYNAAGTEPKGLYVWNASESK